jgi:hypothetical protein
VETLGLRVVLAVRQVLRHGRRFLAGPRVALLQEALKGGRVKALAHAAGQGRRPGGWGLRLGG